ncbi:hypothetical protein K438DRAFT_1798123 [Mycena galopus ATCC 62051]|nr:hypothetical protein K438DRAFT_1798123 [Mycena galopus ATCC 62051]
MLDFSTLLDVFHKHVANPETRSRHIVECADERWTYDDLDIISNGLALELESRYGARPTIAIIAENLPYTLALSIAVWKLRGIVAPMDYHAPAALLQPMLATVSPACVVVPSTEKGTQQVALDAGFSLLSFTPEETSMTALSQRFVDAPDLPRDQYPSPDPTSIFLYIFTSSASNVSNLKCVPLSHETLLSQTSSILEWNRRAFPESVFEHIRVLGFNPFSHIWGFLDIFLYVFLTGGCYIFALTPSSYFLRGALDKGSRDVFSSLLLAMERYRPDSWAAIPFMFDGIMGRIKSEPNSGRKEELIRAMQRLKICEMGGAAPSEECINFVLEHKLALAVGIGMTEVGGLVFKRRVTGEKEVWWATEDDFILDGHFTLVDDGKPNASEGELCVSGKLIAKGYLKQNNPSFALGSDGVITFKTGDRYVKSEGRIKWLGRNDDFVVLLSGEMVDPRILEKTLDASPAIARSCIIGNNFLRGSSLFLCALIELRADVDRNHPSTKSEILGAIRTINRELVPPLRINWTRVIILEEGEQIPINKKRQIWRKTLETLFGPRVAALSIPSTNTSAEDAPLHRTVPSQSVLKDVVLATVAHALNLPAEILKLNADLTFAELGMDSAAALVIVGKLNEHFGGLNLPRNMCHTHVDLNSLTAAVSERLSRLEDAPPQVLPSITRAASLGSSEEVVIVGQAVRLPGDLNTPEAFWEALLGMREDLFVPVPQGRWDHASFYRKPGDPAKPGDITFERAGFVEVESFDNTFFGISAPEAFSVSPSARLVLETTWQALENANIPISRLKGTDTGVFAAAPMDQGFTHLIFMSLGFGTYNRFHGTGSANSAICGRLSYLLDVHGPSASYDTACSSGMFAFDQAVRHLQSGRGETAIVCGGNSHVWPGDFGFTSAQKMTSPNSRCATFASDADGYVPAEGAVTLILKTKRAALRDGDTILAAVKTTDTNHNGRSQGLVGPNSAAQAALQRSLLAAASMSPSDIDFIETHGTGTSLGDLIEIEGINSVFRGSHTQDRPLVLGTAKTVVGHTESVAGLVGIVKAIKQLSTGKVAGLSSLAGGKLNPEIDTALVPLRIPATTADVPARKDGVPLRALVLAYGFAGSLAGTILEAPPVPKTNPTNIESAWMVFAASAKSPQVLNSYLQQYLEFCANAPAEDFQSICYTSCVGRELYRYRFSCVVKDLNGLVQQLKDRLAQTNPPAVPLNSRIIFAFPGQGSQFFGMAKELSERFPQFKEILVDAAKMASSLVEFDILSLMLGTGQPTDEIDKSGVAQICIFVYQYSVAQFLRQLKIVPDAVMGNSLGDISAAVAAGAMSFELGLQFVVSRAKMLSPHPDHPAGMAAVAANADIISKCILDLNLVDRVVISVFSSAGNNVVSGDLEAVRILVSHVKNTGIRATLLNVDQGFHSHCIDPAVPQLEAWNADHEKYFRPLNLPFFSTMLGKQVAENESLGPRYWVDHARNPVRFAQAVEEIKKHASFKTACIVDVGPTPTALAALQSNEMSQATLFSSAAKKGKDQGLAFLTAIASLTEYGVNPDFVALFGREIPKTNILPTYPFQRQRHWPSGVVPSRSSYPFAQGAAPSSFVVDETLHETPNDHRVNGDILMPARPGPLDTAAPVQISFQQEWTPRKLDAELPERNLNSKVVYFGKRTDWINTLSESADKYILGQLAGVGEDSKSLWQTEQLFFAHIVEALDRASDSTVILDATSTVDDVPESPHFSAFWHSALSLMQALGRSKKRSFRLIVISTGSKSLAVGSSTPAPYVLGAMVQGMLRVFRTETGLNEAYGIEFPANASTQVIADALKAELGSKSKESLVAYKYAWFPGEAGISLRRFVPELRPLVEEGMDVQLRGVGVVVGMGSIGAALGPPLIAAGCSTIVFLGRRPPTDEKVAQQLASLSKTSGKFVYMQVDASEVDALRRALQDITATYGEIKNILHTAGSAVEAPIDSFTTDGFDCVIRPKVNGAYNLHVLTGELSLELDSFLMFSGISGPLGNPGQVANATANSFLDSLAAYRRSIGLPGVSLQLGLGESEVEKARPGAAAARGVLAYKITHEVCLPLILRALSSPVPVQAIAAYSAPALSRVRALAADSLFAPLVATVAAAESLKRGTSPADIAQSVESILREILELADAEALELNDSLSAYGIDSIAFGQIRAAVKRRLGVEVPLVYLSDAFTVNQMIGGIQETFMEQAAI